MTNQQTQPSQPYPPQGYYQGQPPKKKHTVRNVLLILIGLGILFIAGCAALFGAAVNEADKAIKQENKNDKPIVVTEGKAFTHDGYNVAGGWTVAKDMIGSITIKGMKVTNTQASETGGSGRTAMLTFRFYKGKSNLAEVSCTSNELQKGESSAMDCSSMASKFPVGYDTIKVADMW